MIGAMANIPDHVEADDEGDRQGASAVLVDDDRCNAHHRDHRGLRNPDGDDGRAEGRQSKQLGERPPGSGILRFVVRERKVTRVRAQREHGGQTDTAERRNQEPGRHVGARGCLDRRRRWGRRRSRRASPPPRRCRPCARAARSDTCRRRPRGRAAPRRVPHRRERPWRGGPRRSRRIRQVHRRCPPKPKSVYPIARPGRRPTRSINRPTRSALTAAEVLKIARRTPPQRSRSVRSTIATTASVKNVALIARSAPWAITSRIVFRRTRSSLVFTGGISSGSRGRSCRTARRPRGAGGASAASASGKTRSTIGRSSLRSTSSSSAGEVGPRRHRRAEDRQLLPPDAVQLRRRVRPARRAADRDPPALAGSRQRRLPGRLADVLDDDVDARAARSPP